MFLHNSIGSVKWLPLDVIKKQSLYRSDVFVLNQSWGGSWIREENVNENTELVVCLFVYLFCFCCSFFFFFFFFGGGGGGGGKCQVIIEKMRKTAVNEPK